MSFRLQILFGLVFCLNQPAMADPPALPTGLDDLGTLDESQSSKSEFDPSLPEGLGALDSISSSEEAVSAKESAENVLAADFPDSPNCGLGFDCKTSPTPTKQRSTSFASRLNYLEAPNRSLQPNTGLGSGWGELTVGNRSSQCRDG